jgi:CRISPR-associated endonuclease Csy4
MDHYVDIEMRPDPEFPVYQLMSALYAKLHRVLAAQGNTSIGVSFPGVNFKVPHLGAHLRLHGNFEEVSRLLEGDWLTSMRDHISLTPPTRVPADVPYRSVKRVQVKSSPDRLRRRLMHRHDIDEKEARQRIPDESARFTDLPFMQLRSNGTKQSFKLFIDHGPVQHIATPGEFNAYGLGHGATIPWF